MTVPACRGKEGGREEQVDREPRGARRVGNEQPRDEPLAGARQDARRLDRGNVAAESDHEGEHRAPVQPDDAHRAIRDDGRAREVSAAIEDSERGEDEREQGHEGEHHAEPGEDPVDHEPLEPPASHSEAPERRSSPSRRPDPPRTTRSPRSSGPATLVESSNSPHMTRRKTGTPTHG